MNATPIPSDSNECEELVRLLPEPVDRDLPSDRHRHIQEFVMSQIQHDLQSAARLPHRTPRRRLAYVGSALAATAMAAVAAVAVTGGFSGTATSQGTESASGPVTPLSGQQILLVAERPAPVAGTPAAPWTLAYHERDAGLEDELTATEVLAAVALGATRRPTLVLARAMPDGNRYSLLERTGDGAWRIRWSSVEGGC